MYRDLQEGPQPARLLSHWGLTLTCSSLSTEKEESLQGMALRPSGVRMDVGQEWWHVRVSRPS